MSFSIIEVIALFFIAINIFIVIVFFFVWLDGFLLKKSRIKSEREYYVNDCLLRVILSYCEYAKFKKEKNDEKEEKKRKKSQTKSEKKTLLKTDV